MARRPLPIGTWGEIKTKRLGHKRYEAHARFRHGDGVTRQHRRRGETADDARDNLKTLFARLAKEEGGGDVDHDTRFRLICEAWIKDLTAEYKIEGKSPNTPKTYRQHMRKWVLPTLGELTAREVTPSRLDKLIQRAKRETSAATARTVKDVLTGVCVYAMRHGAMTTNPVKQVGRISSGKARKPTVALSLEQRVDLLAKLETAAEDTQSAVQRLLPDLTRMMLATGVRVSEVLALSADDVDLSERTVHVRHHLVQPEGGGVIRMPDRKGGGRPLLLGVPEWSLPTWRARKLASGGGPLLAIHNGLWVRPGTVTARWSKVMGEIGYGWVTSHVWRKTVATVLDEAGLTTTEAADQLGNTAAVVEGHYRAPRATNQRAAAALEDVWTRKA